MGNGWTWTCKVLEMSGYIGSWLEKCPDYLTGVRLILKRLGIRKRLDYHTSLGLILLCIWLGFIKGIQIKQIKCH